MPKGRFKSFGKAMMILGGGMVVGYLKCLNDVQKKYGGVIDEEEITVRPCKGMAVGVKNSPKKEGESN